MWKQNQILNFIVHLQKLCSSEKEIFSTSLDKSANTIFLPKSKSIIQNKPVFIFTLSSGGIYRDTIYHLSLFIPCMSHSVVISGFDHYEINVFYMPALSVANT